MRVVLSACGQVGHTFLKNSDREPFLRGLLAALGAGLLTGDWMVRAPVSVRAESGCSVAPPTCTGMKVKPRISLAIPAERSEVRVRVCPPVQVKVRGSPCTGMGSVCQLLAVTVAVATTVCPGGMAAMRPGGPLFVTRMEDEAVLLVEVAPGSLSTGSTNRRRRNPPVGGELYLSCRVVGEGDTPVGGGDYLSVVGRVPAHLLTAVSR